MITRPLHLLAAAACGAALLVGGAPTRAAVLVTGDVTPSDNPFTSINQNGTTGEFTGNEGIQEYVPFFGNIFNPPAGTPDQYTFEEGDTDKVDIEVGRTSFGSLLLNGGSLLRYGHLVIGGDKEDANSGPSDTEVTGSPLGVGVVRIEGFGTVYNNDPDIIPGGLEGITDPTPRATDGGFDVYVGLTGSGTLVVANGGRMEIGDGLIAGLATGSYGEILVEGFSTHIDQRGNGEGDDSLSQMLIGPAGTGLLTIREGAQVDARNGAALGAVNSSGGVGVIGGGMGGIPTLSDTRGGQGIVTVDGLGSTWRIAGGLSVGVFAEDDINEYTAEDGRGEITVSNDGLISILGEDEDDRMVIGRFGRVQLEEGRIVLEADVVSDGVIRGNGRIDASHFRNRRLGQVRVSQGEKLLVVSNAATASPQSDEIGAYFMANEGLIEVVGGEIEFQRLQQNPGDAFRNRVAPATMALPEQRGVILGQNAIMRFQSGLNNEGVLAFTAGDNIIGGDVVNAAGAVTTLSGNSNTTFENNLTNNGVLDLAPDGSIVTLTVLGDFIGTVSAALNVTLGGGPTGAAQSLLAVAGDITLGGELRVALSTVGANPIDPMPGDEFEIISGASGLSGAFNLLDLPALANAGWNWFIDTTDSDVTLVVLDIVPIGGDFNGDGIVDVLDLAIWQGNFGLTMGATGVLGDADGDGDVDGADYLIWLGQVGGAGAAPAAITLAVTAVPEPSSLLLAIGGLAALGLTRRARCEHRRLPR